MKNFTRFTLITALVFAMLAMTACNGDDARKVINDGASNALQIDTLTNDSCGGIVCP